MPSELSGDGQEGGGEGETPPEEEEPPSVNPVTLSEEPSSAGRTLVSGTNILMSILQWFFSLFKRKK